MKVVRQLAVLAALLLVPSVSNARPAAVCAALVAPPETLQVAWVSQAGERRGAQGWMNVVRSSELQTMVAARQRDPAAVLRSLGRLGPKTDARGLWKVVLFDVRREWLCRPMAGTSGTVVEGVPICEHPGQPGIRAKARTECGYLADDGARGLDTYRIRWERASSQGFCVLPFQRFLEGRP